MTPTRVLSEQMRAAGQTVRARVFPANGATSEEGHALCTGGDHPPWRDDVVAFSMA